VVGRAAIAEAAIEQARHLQPDVVLLCIELAMG
jgi:hypothetical protein